MMRVKFYKIMKNGETKKLAVDVFDLKDAVPKMRQELAFIGETMTGISNITIHYDDGFVENGVGITNAKGELTSVAINVFHLD